MRLVCMLCLLYSQMSTVRVYKEHWLLVLQFVWLCKIPDKVLVKVVAENRKCTCKPTSHLKTCSFVSSVFLFRILRDY